MRRDKIVRCPLWYKCPDGPGGCSHKKPHTLGFHCNIGCPIGDAKCLPIRGIAHSLGLASLKKKVKDSLAEWERAVKYSDKVCDEAKKRYEFIYFKGPARKAYERAVQALEKARKHK